MQPHRKLRNIRKKLHLGHIHHVFPWVKGYYPHSKVFRIDFSVKKQNNKAGPMVVDYQNSTKVSVKKQNNTYLSFLIIIKDT